MAATDQIDAEPTKTFFIDMLTRDIPLEQAILDLVDNSVDGAKSHRDPEKGLSGRWVRIQFDAHQFSITDNCGGFGKEAARTYAFKFGRPEGAKRTPHSIGQFGVGMKRALFKFGDKFVVRSATPDEAWAVEVDVTDWESKPGWTFPFSAFEGNADVSRQQPGTEIVVTALRPEVASRFGLGSFKNTILDLLKSKHRQFISEGMEISVNGTHADATDLALLLNDGLRPGTENIRFHDKGLAPVDVRITVAVAPSNPRQAGWYVVCNGRVILEADRSAVTGWGVLEEEANRTIIPSYHNQFARFRGLVFFDSEDLSLVPWNTTKTGIDQDNRYWQATFQRMLELMRPAIDFLNELDADIDEFTKENSPMSNFISKSGTAKPEAFRSNSKFQAPSRTTFAKGPKRVKIQYSRAVDEIELLQDALGVSSAKAVGEATFDASLARHRR